MVIANEAPPPPPPPPARRRSKRSTAGKRVQRLHISSLSQPWRRVYLDVGHCRLQKCIRTVQTASPSEIRQLQQLQTTDDSSGSSSCKTSFVAMAISATASAHGGSACQKKEPLLLDFVRTVAERGLDANDTYNGSSAMALAAYHGFRGLVEFLLDKGGSLLENNCGDGIKARSTIGKNALEAAVRNAQHEVLQLLLQQRPQEAASLFHHDNFCMALERTINRKDVESIRILSTTLASVKPSMCDRAFARMKHRGNDKRCLWPILEQLYPNLATPVASWSKQLHWSFPTSDRHALNLLWHSAGSTGQVFPREVWLVIFSFMGRGWFIISSNSRNGNNNSSS